MYAYSCIVCILPACVYVHVHAVGRGQDPSFRTRATLYHISEVAWLQNVQGSNLSSNCPLGKTDDSVKCTPTPLGSSLLMINQCGCTNARWLCLCSEQLEIAVPALVSPNISQSLRCIFIASLTPSKGLFQRNCPDRVPEHKFTSPAIFQGIYIQTKMLSYFED